MPDTEVVLVEGGGAPWTKISEVGEEPELWCTETGLKLTIHRLSTPRDLNELAQACETLEGAGYAVVLKASHQRIIGWLNAGGTGWPPKDWKPGDRVPATQ